MNNPALVRHDRADACTLVSALWQARVPYGWQRRLLSEWLLNREAPAFVDVPTGLGKTSVIALWLAARAAGAALPRRLVYVVDRRAVVDQATKEAESLRERLAAILAGSEFDIEVRAVWARNLGLSSAGAGYELCRCPPCVASCATTERR